MSGSELRLALVTPDLRVGGAEQLLVAMLETWRQTDEPIAPLVYAFRDGPIRAQLETCARGVWVSPSARRINPFAAGWLGKSFVRDHIELVHLHLPRAGFYGRLAARRLGLPVLYTEHNTWEMYDPLSRLANRATYALNTHVAAVSQAVLASIRRHIDFPDDRLTCLYNGIRSGREIDPEERRAMRQDLGLSAHALVLGNIANLHARKGHSFLLQALPELVAEHGEVHCLIVGRDDGEGPSLLRLARDLGVETTVHWLGYRPDARQLLAACDVFVLPSLFEGMPLALIEAMDAGLPAVATHVGGNPELVVHGETGLLVQPENPAALRSAIGLLFRDPARRAAMGRAGRARVRAEFTVDRMAARYAGLYRTIMKEHPRTR